jgi:carbamoyl-phosphate synthase large subunit
MKILTEASGSLTSSYLIKAIKEAGHEAVGSDINEFNHAKYFCDDFIIMPKINDESLWDKTLDLLLEHNVDAVIPSLDETMVDWSNKKKFFKTKGIEIIISIPDTVEVFQDKYKTYKFFKSIDLKTPKTSLNAEYELIKPRLGRGGSGIFINDFKTEFCMDEYISQEKISGEEYTVDVFFDYQNNPIYIVPRKRIDVKDGKSTKGEVVKNDMIDELIIKISKNIKFLGAINFQLFITDENEIFMIEVNPRIAGGMALGFAATENWIPLMIDNIIYHKDIIKKDIEYGMKMFRYYDEVFI